MATPPPNSTARRATDDTAGGSPTRLRVDGASGVNDDHGQEAGTRASAATRTASIAMMSTSSGGGSRHHDHSCSTTAAASTPGSAAAVNTVTRRSRARRQRPVEERTNSRTVLPSTPLQSPPAPAVSSDERRRRSAVPPPPRRGLLSRSLLRGRQSRDDGGRTEEERIRLALDAAGEDLVDRLFAYLSRLPEPGSSSSIDNNDDGHRRRASEHHMSEGITLPAAAVGWLTMQFQSEPMDVHDDDDEAHAQHDRSSARSNASADVPRDSTRGSLDPNSSLLMAASPSSRSDATAVSAADSLRPTLPSRLALLRYVLPRLTGLRITGDEWPVAAITALASSRTWKGLSRTAEDPQMTTGDSEPSSLQRQFRNLMYRPLVDLQLFSNLQVLVLNRVPVDHVRNLASLTHLQVLRIENSCVYSLPDLMTVSTSDPADRGMDGDQPSTSEPSTIGLDPLQIQHPVRSLLPNLRCIRISNCSLTSDALRMRRAVDDEPHERVSTSSRRRSTCPIEKMTRLESICLSHNQLHNSQGLLRSLRGSKPWLSELDVSYNYLGHLRNAHKCLGNLQSLSLSHNRLTTVDGVDRLLSLEHLWLNDNLLPTLASVASLARLPLLRTLHLRHNPLTIVAEGRSRDGEAHRRLPTPNDAVYRMYVFDLFLQRRMPILTGRTTLREVQEALDMTLDGKRAAVRELMALRTRAYVSVDVMPTALGPASAEAAETSPDAAADDFVHVERNQDVTLSDANRSGMRARSRRRRPNAARIMDESIRTTTEPKQPSLGLEEASTSAVAANFSILDVLEHLAPPPDESNESLPMEESCRDVDDDAALEKSVEPSEMLEDEVHGESTTQQEIAAPIGEPEASQVQVGDVTEDQLDLVSASSMNDSRLGTDLDLSNISPIHHRTSEGAMKASGATTAATSTGEAPHLDEVQVDKVPGEGSVCIDTTEPGSGVPSAPLEDRPASESSNTTPIQQLSYRVPTSTSLWQDDNLSVASCSVGGAGSMFDETVAQHKYVAAEENSVFDAVAYKDLNVMQNLDLYFRMFVFNYDMLPENAASTTHSIASASALHDRNDWVGVLESYPKIQLWPIDRRMREAYADKARLAGKDDSKEEFRMVWREKVVACGKPALRRLTPSRGARFGFHGELLWSDASASHIKPETVAEPREILLCMSNTTLYFIVTNDSVSTRLAGKDPFRKFPNHIPDDATFENGRWPHALGWHPFHTLTGITIGFFFQRLTLRFANSTFPSPDDFTYVLLTCNKLDTVRLLKELQALVVEAQRDGTQFGASQPEIKIDNDDRHVLDALGVAVAPDVIGMVLHYQILSQHWRHGDRGSVRRVCLVTDTTVYLLDEDYIGDGSESLEAGFHRSLGETTYRVVDSAPLSQISIVKAADSDPCTLTLSIRPTSRLARTHNWRLTCRDRHGAEQLLEDVRKAIAT